MPRLSRRFVAALFIGSLALAASVPTAAADGIRVFVAVPSICIDGIGPARTRHHVTLRAPDGRVRATESDRSDASGRWSACFFTQQFIIVNVGDRIEVDAGALSTAVRVPDRLPRIDRDTDVIRGKGPKGGSLRVTVGLYKDAARTWVVDVRDDGRWRLDTSGEFDLIGGDVVAVVERRHGDRFQGLGVAPFVIFGPQSNVVTGAALPGERVSVELTNGGETRASAAAASVYGTLLATLEDERGRPVYPRTGDVLTTGITGGVSLEVPRWNLSGTGITDTVNGRCLADARFRLEIGDAFPSVVREGRTNAHGRFSRRVDTLKRGQDLALTCFYPGGDQLQVGATVE